MDANLPATARPEKPRRCPCNANGFHLSAGGSCYDAACKARYAEFYVR